MSLFFTNSIYVCARATHVCVRRVCLIHTQPHTHTFASGLSVRVVVCVCISFLFVHHWIAPSLSVCSFEYECVNIAHESNSSTTLLWLLWAIGAYVCMSEWMGKRVFVCTWMRAISFLSFDGPPYRHAYEPHSVNGCAKNDVPFMCACAVHANQPASQPNKLTSVCVHVCECERKSVWLYYHHHHLTQNQN